ncbi:MAG: hypothetical protein OK454_11160, partial [Thaumarchaeota archaeon]|nr:hypothetical protein [Nitrososphaerota archaeon]
MSKIRALVVGPFFQWLRVEVIAEPSAIIGYVFMMRSHKETENFVAFTKAAAKVAGHHIGPFLFFSFS